MKDKQSRSPSIRYVPPSDEMIDTFVRKFCEKLQMSDANYANAEIRHGLSSYVKLVTSIVAKRKNEEETQADSQLLDNDAE